MSGIFSAGSSAIGYLYQVRYALYMILDKIDLEVSIEGLDDVSFEENGKAVELLQLKHHINQQATLTDGCSDLWKTIRVWSEAIKFEQVIVSGVMFSLITTSTAAHNSIASLLKLNKERNPKKAQSMLVSYAQKSKSKTNQSAYQSFLSLSDEQQIALIENIYIIDKSENILNVENMIKKELRLSARPRYLNALYERLEGWWCQKTIEHLANGSKNTIKGIEVHEKLQEILEQLRDESLPIDYLHEDPPEVNPKEDKRRFVQQLKIIAVSNKRIENAMRDFYRASEQRSRWVSDELVSVGELINYERRLVEEWEEQFEIVNEMTGEEEDIDEKELQSKGRVLYNEVIKLQYLNIRRNVTEPYIMRGSLHILANTKMPKIGWHPFFKEILELGGKEEAI
ncbi:hypothetical protein L2095_05875 [Bacillus zanthoxyli]|nr:hypothetical protein [Bacillus zanthoxyli]